MAVTAVFLFISLFYYFGSRYDRLLGGFGFRAFSAGVGWNGMGWKEEYGLSWLFQQIFLLLLSDEIDATFIITLEKWPRSVKALEENPASVGLLFMFLTQCTD